MAEDRFPAEQRYHDAYAGSNLKSGYTVDYGMLMLGVLICTLPTAIVFLFLQKSFANGITGAVK